MIVTDKKYYMDENLLGKLRLCAKRCMRRDMDSLMIVDGDEGLGKTTISCSCAYYVHHLTKMPFSTANVFFEVDDMIQFAAKTERQVIIWDEAALSALSSEWYNKSQLKLIKFLMVSRKKNHFYFFNIPKIFKLKDYLAIDRSLGLIHVYSPDELKRGSFAYYRKDPKERLYRDWMQRRFKSYKLKYDFRGSFVNALSKVIDVEAYDKIKEDMIVKLGAEKISSLKMRNEAKYNKLMNGVKTISTTFPQITKVALAKHLELPYQTLSMPPVPSIALPS